MPEISRFFGIVILMYYSDHPPPHFHVRYGNYKATVTADTLAVYAGHLPPRVLGLVIEWAALHREELMVNWERARLGERLEPIVPLE
jgi:hypothetical protein